MVLWSKGTLNRNSCIIHLNLLFYHAVNENKKQIKATWMVDCG